MIVLLCCIHCMQKLQRLRDEFAAEETIRSMFELHKKDYFDHVKSISECEKAA